MDRMMVWTFAVGMGVAVCGARDLVWSNAAGTGQWNLTDANWYVQGDAAREAVCFESGDNAWFVDLDGTAGTAVTVQRRHPNPKAGETAWNVGRFVVSNELNAFTFTSTRLKNDGSGFEANVNWYAVSGLGSLEKFGAGDVRLNFRFEDAFPVEIHAGRFIAGSGSDYVGEWYGCLGSLYKPHDIVFAAGTTLRLAANTVFGTLNSATAPTLHLNGATLDFAASGQQNFPKTVFDDARLAFSAWQSRLYYSNDTDYLGTMPYAYAVNSITSADSVPTVTFGRNRSYVNVTVADITGNAAPDLVFSNRLVDVARVQGTATYYGLNTFRKKGAGTLAFHNGLSTTTGSFEVVEGTLEIGGYDANHFDMTRTGIGNVNPAVERTITVQKGATVDFKSKLGVMNGPRNWMLKIDGGTLRSSAGPAIQLGALELNDATLDIREPYRGWLPYGYFGVTRLLKVGGTKPFTFALPETNRDQAFLTIGFTDADRREELDPVQHPGFTNLWSVLEMDVADITGSDAVDATVALIVRDMYNMTWRTDSDFSSTGGWGNDVNPYRGYRFLGGIRKTGAGTLRLTNVNTYSHTTEVAEGVLEVDGSIAASSGVTVEAGAYLAGTGTVAAVTFRDGGGLICEVGAKDVLRMPSVQAEGVVDVKVRAPSGMDKKDFRQAILQLTERPETVDLSNWHVAFPGAEEAKGFRFAYDGTTGMVSAHYAGGTLIVVR